MRRLAFLAAASLAFIAIPEPISASQGKYQKRDWVSEVSDREYTCYKRKCGYVTEEKSENRWCYVKPEIKCTPGLCQSQCKRKTGDERSCTNERGRVLCSN